MNLPMVVQVLTRHDKVRNLLRMLLRVANKLIKAIRGWKGHFQKLNGVFANSHFNNLFRICSMETLVFNTLNRDSSAKDLCSRGRVGGRGWSGTSDFKRRG